MCGGAQNPLRLRANIDSDGAPRSTPKGGIPKAKQALAVALELPTLRYIHALRLEAGKFSDLRVL